ncbi:MAG: hypothetical protein ACOZCO_10575 [Bacteroidota bacterium]
MTQSTPATTNVVVPYEGKTSFKEYVIYSLVGALLIGGTVFIGHKIVRQKISDKEDKKALEPDSAAMWAKQIKMAFENDGWWGTDEEALRKVLREIPDKKTFLEVAASFKKNYGKPLTESMQGELTSSEYEEMMMIVAGKPQDKSKGDKPVYNYIAWAKRLRAAVSMTYLGFIPATDEDAIKAVFLELPTQQSYFHVADAYYKEYGDFLYDDLHGDLSQFDITKLVDIMKQKPKF